MSDHYVCPICNKPGQRSPRYPKYICVECGRRATDKTGRPHEFSNESASGGYVAWYRDTHEPYESHICYVDSIPFWADEAHMGGIVVSVYDSPIKDE